MWGRRYYFLIFTLLIGIVNAETSRNIAVYELPKITVIGDIDDADEKYSIKSSFFNPNSDSIQDLVLSESSIRFEGSERINGQEINMRGYGTNHVIKAIDGIKIRFNSQHDGSVFVDPQMINTIDIIKGGSSHLYGSGAAAGYVSFNTLSIEEVLKRNHHMKVGAGLGSAAHDKSTFIALAHNLNDAKFMVAGSYRNTGNIRLGNGDSLYADDSIHSLLVKTEIELTNNSHLRFNLHHYQNNATEPNNPQISETKTQFVSSKAFRKYAELTDKRIRADLVGLEHNYFSDGGNIDLTTSFAYTDTSVRKRELTDEGVDPQDTTKEKEVRSYIFTMANQNELLNFGLEYTHDQQFGRKNGSSYPLIPSGTLNDYAVFANLELPVMQRPNYDFYIIMGFRGDVLRANTANLDKNYEHVSSSLRALFNVADNNTFYADFSHNFRAPNLSELFADGTHFRIQSLSNNFMPNLGLRPETVNTYEVGFNTNYLGKNKLVMKGFISNYNSYIEQQISGNTLGTLACPYFNPSLFPGCSLGITQFINIDDAVIKGFEFEHYFVYEALKLNTSIAKAFGYNRVNNRRIAREIPFTIVNEMRYSFDQHLFAGGEWKVAAPFTDTLGQRIHGYGVVNFVLGYDIAEDLQLLFKVDNILDKSYVKTYSNVYARARDFQLKLSYRW